MRKLVKFSNIEKPNVVIIENGCGFGGSVISIAKTAGILRDESWPTRLLIIHKDSDVADYLKSEGSEVFSIWGYRRPDKLNKFLGKLNFKLAKRLVLLSIIVAEIPLLLYSIASLVWQLIRWRPDLVVFNNQYDGFLWLATRFTGIGCGVIFHSRSFPPAFSWLNPRPRIWPLMVANSFAVKDSLLSLGWPGDRVKVVYNPFDFAGKFECITSVTDEPWATDDMLRVALVGSLEPWKGHELFFEAARIVIKERSNVKFFVVGGEGLSTRGRTEELKETARKLGLGEHIVFLGHRLDVYRVAKTMHVVVHASLTPEPFGNVIVEAMLLGRAVVAADEGGPREIITHGTDGLLVSPRDPSALAEAVARLLKDDDFRRFLGKNAVTSACERFSHKRYRSDILNVYKTAIEEY